MIFRFSGVVEMVDRKLTRQEVIAISGVTSSKLSCLERLGLIDAERIGNTKKPYVFYTEDQLTLIIHLAQLSEWFTLDSLHAFIEDDRVKMAMLEFLKAVS